MRRVAVIADVHGNAAALEAILEEIAGCGAEAVVVASRQRRPAYEGRHGAFWLLLGPDVELRRTDYDVERAAATTEASGFGDAWEEASEMLLHPPTAHEVEEHFERVAAERGEK